jgi:hypothetical protein
MTPPFCHHCRSIDFTVLLAPRYQTQTASMPMETVDTFTAQKATTQPPESLSVLPKKYSKTLLTVVSTFCLPHIVQPLQWPLMM